MRVPRPCLILRGVVIAVLSVPLVACTGVRVAPPSAKEYAAARGGRAAVVMLRGVAESPQGGERALFRPGSSPAKSISLARLDAPGEWSRAAALRAPDAGALRGGWVYLVLKPGTYYLLVHDTVPPGLAPETAAPGEDWLLEVPEGSPLVYAGTVVFAGAGPSAATTSSDHAGHAGHAPVGVATRVRDDAAEARKVGSNCFAGLAAGEGATVRASLVRRYSGPADPGPSGPQVVSARPRVRVDGTPPPKGYGVQNACAQDGAWYGLLYGDPILKGAGSSTNTAADLLLFMVKMGLYAWAGTGAIAGSVAGVGEARDVQPCVTQAVGWARDFDLARRLSESVTQRLTPGLPGGAGAGDGEGPELHVSVQELHLRPCRKAHLACVEARVRVRLWDPQAGRHLKDCVLLYSNAAARHRIEPYGQPLPPYVLPVDQAAVLNLRSLARMPAAERRARVEAELGRAVAALSQQITRQLPPPGRARLTSATSTPAPWVRVRVAAVPAAGDHNQRDHSAGPEQLRSGGVADGVPAGYRGVGEGGGGFSRFGFALRCGDAAGAGVGNIGSDGVGGAGARRGGRGGGAVCARAEARGGNHSNCRSAVPGAGVGAAGD